MDKRYEEALERAKQGMPIDVVFPELKESEEERIREEIIRFLYAWRGDSKVDKWIAYLEKQKEHKPAEWSEKDEKMIERLIRHTQKEFDELCNDRYGHQEIISDLKESCRERMNWLENRLKSLCPQPHWKPSEEQIQALTVAIDEAARCEDPWWRDSLHDVLLSLHTDLLKLL